MYAWIRQSRRIPSRLFRGRSPQGAAASATPAASRAARDRAGDALTVVALPIDSATSAAQAERLLLRAACADDRERLMRLYDRLSPLTIYHRLFLPAPHGPEWAARFAALSLRTVASGQAGAARIGYGGALVALTLDQAEIVAVAQYSRDESRSPNEISASAPGSSEPAPALDAVAEIALVVEDAWQGRGVGTYLLRALLCEIRAAGYAAVSCQVVAENRRAHRFVTQRLRNATARFEDGVYDFYAHLESELEPRAEPCGARSGGGVDRVTPWRASR